jgi:hypothetical protein
MFLGGASACARYLTENEEYISNASKVRISGMIRYIGQTGLRRGLRGSVKMKSRFSKKSYGFFEKNHVNFQIIIAFISITIYNDCGLQNK